MFCHSNRPRTGAFTTFRAAKLRLSPCLIAIIGFLPIQLTYAEGETAPVVEEDIMLLYGDAESISIATGTSKPLHLAPSVSSVITYDQIKAAGATDLDQALEMVPGLHVGKSFNRLNSIYSIRGIHTGNNAGVLFLINGTRISDHVTGGRFPTFRMPVENITRIEVIRGPGSAVYGADAFSGVINVITKEADDIRGTNIGGRIGSFNSLDTWLQHSHKEQDWVSTFSMEWSKSNGDDQRIVKQDAIGTSGPLSTRYNVLNTRMGVTSGHWNMSLWNWRQMDGGVGPGAAQILDPNGRQDVNHYSAELNYRNDEFSDNWQLEIKANQQQHHQIARYTISPGLFGEPGGKLRTTGVELSGYYSGLNKHHIRLSTGYRKEMFNPEEYKNFSIDEYTSVVTIFPSIIDVSRDQNNVFMSPHNRDLLFFSLQDEWKLARDWELTAGARWDTYSDFGNTVNPRLALVWDTKYNLTSKFLYGRSFRAPVFNELYFQHNPSLIGYPNLKPETIDTIELAFDYRPSDELHTLFNVFGYETENLIDPIKITPGSDALTAQNLAGTRGLGFETELIWSPHRTLQTRGSYALQHSEYRNTGKEVKDAPRRQLKLSLDWAFQPQWSLGVRSYWIGNRPRDSNDSRPELKEYTLVNIALRYRPFDSSWEFAALANNIFDHRAYEPSNGMILNDYPLASRSLFAEVRYHLNAPSRSQNYD